MSAETFPGSSRGDCRAIDPSLFFPERGDSVAAAVAVCGACPVRIECREYAIAHEREGIWGGLTGKERRAERRRLGITIDTPGTPGELYGWRSEARVAS